jgi:hypothetical protein
MYNLKENEMKKLIAIAALATSSVMAAEVAVYTNTGAGAKEITATIGNQTGYVGMSSGRTQDRFAVGREKEIMSFGKVGVFAGSEVAFLRNATSSSGFAFSPFVGAEYALTKNTGVAVIVARQYGQDRVKQFNGTSTVVGIRTNF